MLISGAKILDFDIETAPRSFMGGGFTTDEITAIACSFTDTDFVNVFTMHYSDFHNKASFQAAYRNMLINFVEMYDKADIVTGHYIRGFDLGKINGALIEAGLNPLGVKMVCDTKCDLIKFSGISKSQENLGAMLSYFDQRNEHLGNKEHMSQIDWRWSNRYTVEGVAETTRRVAGDVKQHKELRLALLKANALRGPRAWRP